MNNSKEQLMSDIALMIKGKTQIQNCNNTINKENNKLRKMTLNNIKRKNMLFFLLPALAIIILSIILFHSVGLFFIGAIVFGVWIFQNKKIKNPSKHFLTSNRYENAQKEVFEQDSAKLALQNIRSNQSTLSEINQTLNASGVYNRIPNSYSNIDALSAMFNYLYNQRADTLKEAINLFETESHQARLEGQQKHILSKVTETSIDARAARCASNLAATNSAASAHWAREASHNSAEARDYAASANYHASEASRKAGYAAADAHKARKNTERL